MNKYQQETGGALRGGDPGYRLFEQKNEVTPAFFKDIPEAFTPMHQKWLLLPPRTEKIPGIDCVYSKSIRELSPEPYITLSKYDAERLGVVDGSVISIKENENEISLPLKIQEDLCNGIVLVSAGLHGMPVLNWGTWAKIVRSE